MPHKAQALLVPVSALIVGAVIAGVTVFLIAGGRGAESTVSAETDQQITRLIDDWFTAWNTADGQAAANLFAVDGRYVGGEVATTLDGWTGEEIEAGVERRGGPHYQAEATGSPLIIVRRHSYQVVQKWRAFAGSREYFELFNIVDEGGSFKIRFVEDLMPLGWFRLADDLPYQPVSAGE